MLEVGVESVTADLTRLVEAIIVPVKGQPPRSLLEKVSHSYVPAVELRYGQPA